METAHNTQERSTANVAEANAMVDSSAKLREINSQHFPLHRSQGSRSAANRTDPPTPRWRSTILHGTSSFCRKDWCRVRPFPQYCGSFASRELGKEIDERSA